MIWLAFFERSKWPNGRAQFSPSKLSVHRNWHTMFVQWMLSVSFILRCVTAYVSIYARVGLCARWCHVQNKILDPIENQLVSQDSKYGFEPHKMHAYVLHAASNICDYYYRLNFEIRVCAVPNSHRSIRASPWHAKLVNKTMRDKINTFTFPLGIQFVADASTLKLGQIRN